MLAQLQEWGRDGVRVTSGEPLCQAAFHEVSFDILSCLVNELGADVNYPGYIS
jgi:hypothetical protein